MIHIKIHRQNYLGQYMLGKYLRFRMILPFHFFILPKATFRQFWKKKNKKSRGLEKISIWLAEVPAGLFTFHSKAV